MKNKIDAKDKIIKAFLDLISKKGNAKVTVREISKKANVNLASINYHFRTTQNLFNEVENYFTDKIFKINEIFEDSGLDSKQAILAWSKELMNLIYDNPGILWIISNKIIKKESSESFMGKLIQDNKTPLNDLIKDITGVKNIQILTLKTIQIISGIIGPLILYYGTGKEFGINLKDKKMRDSYTETLIESILKK